jgi:hypothetical protein
MRPAILCLALASCTPAPHEGPEWANHDIQEQADELRAEAARAWAAAAASSAVRDAGSAGTWRKAALELERRAFLIRTGETDAHP